MKIGMNATLLLVLVAASVACAGGGSPEGGGGRRSSRSITEENLAKYTTVRLTANLSRLTDNQRRMIPLLIEAAEAMDEAFWLQAYGNRQELLDAIGDP
ncbi:MAG: Zn-dependent hydrolase, partial [Acidobacteriota bacterium]